MPLLLIEFCFTLFNVSRLDYSILRFYENITKNACNVPKERSNIPLGTMNVLSNLFLRTGNVESSCDGETTLKSA